MDNNIQYTSRNYQVNMSGYIQEAIDIFKQYPGGFIGFTVIYFLASAVAASALNLLASIITGPLFLGYFIVARKIKYGIPFEFNDFFKGYEYFAKLVLVFLLVPIFIAVGFVLLFVPGVYLTVAYIFAAPLVFFKGLEFWDAMETSRKVVTQQWWSFFGFVIVLALLNFAGALLLGVGLLITIPISFIAVYLAFDDVFEKQLG